MRSWPGGFDGKEILGVGVWVMGDLEDWGWGVGDERSEM